ncbi:hypothetical protein PHSY_004777 [Pseudozyma hubeiensis SY62]|uniref:RDRP core domain-containing protein n=1 Tax=Pseudozyma hubeiensis (strain SY62) TaxID=1305764 RepID=R9P7F9_PSEHS|nr:hypothetical protein PHSY_004777 [Pseudozyma hubeiensis SY62]GAC97192.1 hypothetical protein PHSY_004777 [Pseudozyma hubeiensis SY62]
MEVFVGRIPATLDGAAIERFIYALVQKECRLTTTSVSASATGVTAKDINKGFYFKRIDTKYENDFGIITFADVKVAQWFISRAQTTDFVWKYNLKVDEARQVPTKAFIQAIEENATEQQPSASRQQHERTFQLDLVRVGYWSAKDRFSYTQSLSDDYMRLSIDEQGVIKIIHGQGSLSFLPRDVRAYKQIQAEPLHSFLFDLHHNPLLRGELAPPTRSPHHFSFPSRVVMIDFRAHRLSKLLIDLFVDTKKDEVDPRQIQVVQDNNGPRISAFFQRSAELDIELAFLREILLRNELVGISVLRDLGERIDKLVRRGQSKLAVLILKNLVPRLEARKERGKSEEQTRKIALRLWQEASDEAVGNGVNGLLTFFEPSLSNDDGLLSQFLHIDVTPTRILLSGPHYHMSNRVIRSYRDHWHHFARVTFTNESREGATTINPNYGFDESEHYILDRVLTFLKEGINIAGRHWDLLAWSSSSMSTHTVWFVTPFTDKHGRKIDADFIRKSLGDFKDVIRKPALYGARLSQAFSATASTVHIPQELMYELPDIYTHTDHGKQNHTDGVGQISPALMADVWESYVSTHGEHRKRKLLKASAPSAIQIRLGGSKGMLAVNPRLQGKMVCIRRSMFKFSSEHQSLEVANSSTRCLPAKLNRPLINALDCREVPAQAFLDIQKEAISQIGRARSKFNETARLCSAFSFGTGCNLRILFEKIHRAGLGASTVHADSFFLVLAKAVTAAALGDMKRKARIPVKGVTLLGIADEFAYLKEGEIFVQVETVESYQVNRRILTGRKLIGRSPTIDPSDITMVECRKPPPGHPLLQLRNVIVFNTCKKKQPLPRRLGGGDLDGDLYTVYEEERIFPHSHQPDAVFHDKVEPLRLLQDCNAHDLADFFADFMLNDFIGLVSHLHLRIADASEYGSEDPRCKTLAKLHSQATDFRKTGVAVKRNQLPRMREPIIPDFLAQSEKRDGKLVYQSSRVLGQMYREVSWGETDTPSLDKNTDAETGLERVPYDEWDAQEDEEADSELGSDYEPHEHSVGSSVRATMGAGTAPAFSTTAPSDNGTSSHPAPSNSLASRISGVALPRPSSEHSVDATPWQFKDRTFPQLLERIGWTNEYFLKSAEDDAAVTAEGFRYVGVFLWFIRRLRSLSRQIAQYHPDHAKLMRGLGGSGTPIDGMYLISEVYLLTGRLPWAGVAKRTRTERDNDLLDNMQSNCTVLRKNLCRVSEAGAFGSRDNNSHGQEAEGAAGEHTDTSELSQPSSTVVTREGQSSESEGRRGASSSSRLSDGNGSEFTPHESDSMDEETPLENSSRSPTPRPQQEGNASETVMNTIQPGPNRAEGAAGLKRKASQEGNDADRRSRSLTPTTLSVDTFRSHGQSVIPVATVEGASTPRANQSTLSSSQQDSTASLLTSMVKADISEQIFDKTGAGAELDDMISFDDTDDGNTTEADHESEAEEGELTVESAQKTVDSLWRACHFFCSPLRPRYSNLYGYNTFMITLTLHLLSTLETLKHLQRDQVGGVGRRYFQGSSRKGKAPVRTEQDPYHDPLEQFEEEEEEYEFGEGEMMENDDREVDDGYSLTEETMRALNLGQILLDDMAPSVLGFDG